MDLNVRLQTYILILHFKSLNETTKKTLTKISSQKTLTMIQKKPIKSNYKK